MPAYLSWLENPVHTRSVIGSNPIAGTFQKPSINRGSFLYLLQSAFAGGVIRQPVRANENMSGTIRN